MRGLVDAAGLGSEGIKLVEGTPAVYVERANAFIIADLHLGFEEAMADTGVFLPRIQYRSVLSIIRELASTRPSSKLVVAGDFKHCFQKLRGQERVEVAKLAREVERLGFKELIVVRGNHDNYLKTVLSPLGLDLVEGYLDLGGGVIVAHGHEDVSVDYEYIVMGHEHPAIRVSVGGGAAKFPAFLLVPLTSGVTALVLPPAGPYQVGNIVSTDKRAYLSPIIREKGVPEEALPIILDEETGLMPLVRLSLLEEMLSG